MCFRCYYFDCSFREMVFHKAYWPVPLGDWDTNNTMNKRYLIDFYFSLTVTSYFISDSCLTYKAKLRTTSQRSTYLQYVHGCYQLLSLFPLIIQLLTW